MAEEIQITECNGDRHPEIPQVTNIIDQMDTVKVCEMHECDPVTPSESKEGSGICLEDKIDSLEINKENTEEEHQAEQDIATEQDSGMLTTSHNAYVEEHSNGDDCKTTLEVEVDNAPAHDSPGQKEINEEEKDQEEIEAEAQDMFMHEQAKPLSETGEEEMLSDTEEENTSIETDNDNGQGSCDEQENGPEEEASGNRPDISRNSYSKYDTVSYRKIRKGNTKQRIDEFESMMN